MLNTKGDFYLFRENIQPEWEDPGNTNGGSLCASIDSLKVDEYWLKTLLHIVGNNFEDLSDHLCGAELAVRVKRFRICLWVKNVSLEIVAKIAQKFKILVGQVCLEYKKHGRDAVVCKF
jgi:translation initiation factor 4E